MYRAAGFVAVWTFQLFRVNTVTAQLLSITRYFPQTLAYRRADYECYGDCYDDDYSDCSYDGRYRNDDGYRDCRYRRDYRDCDRDRGCRYRSDYRDCDRRSSCRY